MLISPVDVAPSDHWTVIRRASVFVAWSFDHGRHRLTLFAGAFQKGFITAPPDDGSGYRIGYIKNTTIQWISKNTQLKRAICRLLLSPFIHSRTIWAPFTLYDIIANWTFYIMCIAVFWKAAKQMSLSCCLLQATSCCAGHFQERQSNDLIRRIDSSQHAWGTGQQAINRKSTNCFFVPFHQF